MVRKTVLLSDQFFRLLMRCTTFLPTVFSVVTIVHLTFTRSGEAETLQSLRFLPKESGTRRGGGGSNCEAVDRPAGCDRVAVREYCLSSVSSGGATGSPCARSRSED